MFCLEEGRLVLENLRHVVFDCPSYARARDRLVELGILEKCSLLFCLHRNHRSFSELKAIRRFYCEVTSVRVSLAGVRERKVRRSLQDRAEAAW